MSTYIKMDGYVAVARPGGVLVTTLTLIIALPNGSTVEFPALLLPIGAGLAITPAIRTGVDGEVCLDFTRWSPARVDGDLSVRFPVVCADQATAVAVARAFDADPATSWRDPVTVMVEWANRFAMSGGAA
ncbi:hypothetical protein [Actinophytocola sediminis]